MRRTVLVRKTLRDVRTAALWIGIANFAMALFVVVVYPRYHDQLKDFEMPAAFRGLLGEAGGWATPAGFLTAEFFSWVPLLLITLAIIGATGALAGEEGAGTLDRLGEQQVTRTRLVLEKTAGLALAVIIATAVCIPGFAIGLLFVDMDLSLARITLAVANMLPVSLLFLTLSLWAAAALPSRGAAAAVAIGAVVATYFLNAIGGAVEALDGVRKLSPFYWSDASGVLLHGFRDWPHAAGLLAIAGVFLLLAVHAFARREIAGSAREWRLRLPHLLHRGGPALPSDVR
jgi:ABC-2 type transport system permease protein